MISKVKQTDIADCGTACVKSILYHFGINQELASIKRFHPLKINYYSFYELSEIFQKYNLEAIGYFTDFAELTKSSFPMIAHVKLLGFLPHFIVIQKVLEKEIFYMDPNKGKIMKMQKAEFLDIWTGRVMIISSNGSNYDFKISTQRRITSFFLNNRSKIFFFLLLSPIVWVIVKVITT
jgi:ABC-type bacteriocin/lantibiotic exporter with double-glycine peptidase domain